MERGLGVGAMELAEYLAIPYVLCLESVPGPDGAYVCRAEYPELGACVVLAPTAWQAVEELDAVKAALITARLGRGEAVAVPRPPLPELLPPRLLPPRLLPPRLAARNFTVVGTR